ncbi:hypothetical protein [uncultured Desulfobacter sp.]|uniref:hypothetical protein n=1 Tax=uncultured Desulfobacter sp. TaxID=240139 RepID=UPI0029C6FF90|nr:hypothetical protein [uncultured Desulfobacter sp.]
MNPVAGALSRAGLPGWEKLALQKAQQFAGTQTSVWMKSCPDARRRKICNRSNLMVVRIANFSATPQVGDFSSKH